MKKNRVKQTIVIALMLGATSCASRRDHQAPKLVSLQLIDRHGFNETISTQDRLDQYAATNFLDPQTYQKVVRLFQRNTQGKIASIVTSYHENGHIWQSLDVVNGRAHGVYQEWYPSGILKVKAHVIEGRGDVAADCMSTWVFDKESFVYDEKGRLMAKFSYDKGELSGKALYYHSNGTLCKMTPYVKNVIHGDEIFYDEQEEKIGKFSYSHGVRHGRSLYQGSKECPKFVEEYTDGKLWSAVYYNFQGRVMSKVAQGEGLQTLYDKGKLAFQYAIKEGKREGKVYVYSSSEMLESEYSTKEGVKHGEEWVYYSKTLEEHKPKLYLNWYEGQLQGRVKSWYPNGALESEREMYHNKKNGPALAWYKNGDLMLTEEYENDLLIKGLYRKKGEKSVVSTIENGEGMATLYDNEGHFLKKVVYHKGAPIED
ncbi:MAG: hypothetical protein FJZ63_03330 [Chlamydiae bacterium]|nr:hypothetical protein [Chlamydiota bacterium]